MHWKSVIAAKYEVEKGEWMTKMPRGPMEWWFRETIT